MKNPITKEQFESLTSRPILSGEKAARVLGVSWPTVRNWMLKGLLTNINPNQISGKRLLSTKEVLEFGERMRKRELIGGIK